jgi:hypothetical protein
MTTACHLCERALHDAPVVGERARGGVESRRVTCLRCGLVQVAPQLLGLRIQPIALTATQAVLYADMISHDLALQPGATIATVSQGAEPLLAEMERRGFGSPTDGPHVDVVIGIGWLQQQSDPLDSLAFVRSVLKPGGAVWLEVPNVHQPEGPLEAHFWRADDVYAFSPPTLVSMLVRAGFSGSVFAEVGGALQAIGFDLGASPRDYLPHGALGGEWVAQYLAAHAARHEPDSALAQLAGPAASESARREREILRSLQPEVERLVSAYAAGEELMRRTAEKLYEEAFTGLATGDDDGWVTGYRTGEALALQRCARILTHAANAMVLASQERSG